MTRLESFAPCSLWFLASPSFRNTFRPQPLLGARCPAGWPRRPSENCKGDRGPQRPDSSAPAQPGGPISSQSPRNRQRGDCASEGVPPRYGRSSLAACCRPSIRWPPGDQPPRSALSPGEHRPTYSWRTAHRPGGIEPRVGGPGSQMENPYPRAPPKLTKPRLI